jgi:tRNA-specific 2-thiouridylase
MARDKSKDQSYFLCEIKKEVLPRLIFPLGEWIKEDVKAFASQIEILQDIAVQKESSEICFVENDYTEILEKHMDIDLEGETVDSDGNVVGNHKGYMHYTIGKRRGFFVNGAHDPHYVIGIEAASNRIVVGTKEKLEVYDFDLKQINLFEELSDFHCDVKVRYRTRAVPAYIRIDGERATVELKEAVFGLAKGQIAAFYDKERLLGGGVIC